MSEQPGAESEARRQKPPRWFWFTLGFGLTGPLAFLFAGIRARKLSWIVAAAVYAVPFAVVMSFTDADGVMHPGWLENPTFAAWIGLWFASIIHALVSAQEYSRRIYALEAHRGGVRSSREITTDYVLRPLLLAPPRRPEPLFPKKDMNKAHCVECSRQIGHDGRWYSDGMGELMPYCAGCAQREFGTG